MPIEPGIPLTKEEIFKRITEEQIFEKYLGIRVDDEFHHNPLRIDKKAGCKYYRNNAGRLYFKDFSKGYHWDCFNVVETIYNCNFIEACRQIIRDFKLNNTPVIYEQTYEPTIKSRITIQIMVREWNQQDINYWGKGGLTIDNLVEGRVYPCKAVWLNGEEYRCKTGDPCYAYYFGNGLYKLYFPFRTEHRFFQNIHLEDNFLQGYSLLKRNTSLIIITKSYKDVLCFRKLGIEAVSPISETQIITQEHYDEFNKDFDYMATVGDRDYRGRMFMLKHYTNYGIPYTFFPPSWGKDLFNCNENKGYSFVKEMIEQYKHEQGVA
jgi:hypothetical protein